MRSTLLILTWNEIDGMKAIMPRIKREWVDQIMIIDGGSTDGTIEWAREHGYDVYHQQKPGLRCAYEEVWSRMTGDIVVYFSPDGNSIPEVIPLLVEKVREGADLVIASRYLNGAKSEDDDALTGFGNWVFRTLINLLLNPQRKTHRLTDPLVMLRAHRKDLPARLGVDQPEIYSGLERLFRTPGRDWLPLMSMRAVKYGIHWQEIPADEPPRIGGKRKVKVIRWGAFHLLELAREWLRPKDQRLCSQLESVSNIPLRHQ